MNPLSERTYRIGPLAIAATMEAGPAADVIDATLGLYDVVWPAADVDRSVCIQVTDTSLPGPLAVVGEYLEAANMLVDRTAGGLRASTLGGATATGSFGPDGESWRLDIPPALAAGGRAYEIEDLLSLVLTTGWRRAGWVPLHGGGLVRDGRGLLCVATSGGGKTTFTVSLIRRGWRALGDDKVLLATAAGAPRVVGLLHVLNLDPRARDWFPEIGDLTEVAPYSGGSPKRRQPIEARWPAGHCARDVPHRPARPRTDRRALRDRRDAAVDGRGRRRPAAPDGRPARPGDGRDDRPRARRPRGPAAGLAGRPRP